jgi:predicted methyltransferase
MRKTNNFFSTEYLFPPVEAVKKNQEKYNEFFEENKKYFGQVNKIYFLKDNKLELKEKNFDLVLTFRNTHNWLGSNSAENVYQSIYDVMKKGGVLGIVQHRADEKTKFNFKNGYVKESFLIDFLEDIGFKLLDKSNINQNTKDNKDYKNGVWTLPPRLVLGDLDKQKYLDIGESDRMTLKFIK